MRNGILTTLALLGLSAGVALAQPLPLSQPGLSESASGGYQPPAGTAAGAYEPVPLSTYPVNGPPMPCPSPLTPPSLDSSTKGAFEEPERGPAGPNCWASGEYLYWWFHRSLPPLVTTSSVSTNPGILGQPGTLVLFGNDTDNDQHAGGRFSIGGWLGGSPIGVEATFTFLADHSDAFSESSDSGGNPILGRPVYNVVANHESALSISAPSEFAGSVNASSQSSFWSAEANGIIELGCFSFFKHPDLVVGVRYLDLEETLGISQQSTDLAGGLIGFQGTFFGPGATATVTDRFATRDQFLGGQVGLRGGIQIMQYFYADFMGNLGLGVTHQTVDITGETNLTGTTRTSPPIVVNTTVPGGLLALPSNIGHSHHDEFSIVPEVGITLGWHIFKWWDAYVGYSFIYWDNVVRPGNEIDRAVNPSQLPTSVSSGGLTTAPVRPVFSFNQTEFWAQGISVGMAFRF
jgi:hypothetical protein